METSNLFSFDGKAPCIDLDAYVHPSACLIGDVRIGRGCFVGPHASLRGDHGSIELDAMCNVQDNCVLHSCPGGAVLLRRFAQVGHGAVLHGCSLLENCLVGINATVLDGAIVGQDTLVAAHSLITKGARLDNGALYAGSPARFVKRLSLEAIAALREGALRYVQTARDYRTKLEIAGVALEPSRDPGLNRPRFKHAGVAELIEHVESRTQRVGHPHIPGTPAA